MNNLLRWWLVSMACVSWTVLHSHAGNEELENERLTAEILAKDKLFWTAYNSCEIEQFPKFFTTDVEFYHDKGGATVGIDALMEIFKKNLCGGTGSRLRREVVAGSEKVFPLRKGKEIYGAILSGEHVFYILEKGKGEVLDGRANYTHLWLKRNGELRMARVLSYDHRPALPELKRPEGKGEGGRASGGE